MATTKLLLRPPLPPPLSHEDITFISPEAKEAATLRPETIAAIASALHALLPPGDCTTLSNGQLVFSSGSSVSHNQSVWHIAGLLEAIERSAL